MKHSLFNILLLFVLSSLFGQNKFLSIPTYQSGDTSYSYKWIQLFTQDKSLADLKFSTDSLRFRISTTSTSVEVWTDDYFNFNGKVSAFIECSDSSNAKNYTTFSKPISNLKAHEIFNIMMLNQIFNIPTDDKIKGWVNGFDGEVILIEYSTPTFYSFKKYWTPSIFKQIDEARVIDSVQRQVWTLVNKIKFDTLLLPKGCYYLYSGVKGIQITPYKGKKRKASR